jgi:hypothetical protein
MIESVAVAPQVPRGQVIPIESSRLFPLNAAPRLPNQICRIRERSPLWTLVVAFEPVLDSIATLREMRVRLLGGFLPEPVKHSLQYRFHPRPGQLCILTVLPPKESACPYLFERKIMRDDRVIEHRSFLHVQELISDLINNIVAPNEWDLAIPLFIDETLP